MTTETPMVKQKVIDLFCGCGGMSWGMQQQGFEILLGIDNNEKYIKTFEHNFGTQRTKLADIRNINGNGILDLVNLKRGELDFLVGGPPCQGFSKNTPRKKRLVDSENNLLMFDFLKYCSSIFPKNIILENVAEMKNGFDGEFTDIILKELESLGYQVIHHVFDASEYGIPQRRRRAFFLATRGEHKPSIAPPTHVKQSKMDLIPLPEKINVWDAIGDLPSLEHGEGEIESKYTLNPKSAYQQQMRNGCQILTNHIARKLSPIQFERLSSLKPGQGLKDLPEYLKVSGGYSGSYGRLTQEMIAPTITRWAFHPGSGRWGHPIDIRTLTPREIARIQGFTDDFYFLGSYNNICGQLGNAVPALLMATIVRCFTIPSK